MRDKDEHGLAVKKENHAILTTTTLWMGMRLRAPSATAARNVRSIFVPPRRRRRVSKQT